MLVIYFCIGLLSKIFMVDVCSFTNEKRAASYMLSPSAIDINMDCFI